MLVNYAASLYRLVIAIAFVVLIARKLSVYEFGLWGIAFSLANVFSIPTSIWMGWARRFVARGVRGAIATSIVLNVAYVALVSPIYLLVSWLVSLPIGGFEYLALYGLGLLIVLVLYSGFSGLSDVLAPEVTGYATGMVPTLRLGLAVVLVLFLHMGLAGAFISVIVARSVGAAFHAFMLLRKGLLTWDGLSKELALNWFKRAYVSIIGVVNAQLRNIDRTIVAVIAGSATPAAYLGAAYTARTPIGEAGRSVSLVLAARLLREARGEDVVEALRMCFVFVGYVLVTLVVIGKPILSLLNPKYVVAYPAFVLTALGVAVSNISNIYVTSSTASETADLDLDASLIRTRLVRTPLAVLGFNAVALAGASVVAWFLRGDAVAAATVYPAAWLLASIGVGVVARRHALEAVRIRFPWREALAVAAASLVSGLAYLALGAQELVVTSFWDQAPLLLGYVVVGLACYLLVLFVLSEWFRELVRAIVNEVLRVFGV